MDHADLTVPPGARAGLIPLHPANDPSRGSLLFADLAEQLPPLGVAVLRYDRRPGVDIPLEAQADDALEAAADLRAAVGDPALPIVLLGYSQGAWACLIAAARGPGIAGLALLGASGVSPAQQMRYTTGRQLLEAGYGEEDVADLRRLRTEGERYIRREQGGSAFQPVIDEYAGRPWFRLAFIPREVPETPEPWEMDFDPATLLGQITCPVLAVYGDDDQWCRSTPASRCSPRCHSSRSCASRAGACAHHRPRGRGARCCRSTATRSRAGSAGLCFAELLLAGAVVDWR